MNCMSTRCHSVYRTFSNKRTLDIAQYRCFNCCSDINIHYVKCSKIYALTYPTLSVGLCSWLNICLSDTNPLLNTTPCSLPYYSTHHLRGKGKGERPSCAVWSNKTSTFGQNLHQYYPLTRAHWWIKHVYVLANGTCGTWRTLCVLRVPFQIIVSGHVKPPATFQISQKSRLYRSDVVKGYRDKKIVNQEVEMGCQSTSRADENSGWVGVAK